MTHKTVLLHTAIDGLNIQPGNIFVDGTLGGGGHTEEVLTRNIESLKIVGIDLDSDALERTEARLKNISASLHTNLTFVLGSFRNMNSILASLNISHVQRILLDIGLSSNQFEDSGRGFSFQKDEPLLMSFKKNITDSDLTAGEILNTWDEENIRAIIAGYGEEKFAYKIAQAIVASRERKPIEMTSELVEIIKSATPGFYHHGRIHPATRTFQALRIAVNDEIEALKEGIEKSFELLSPQGRLAVISFHSLEDRVVKQFFKQREEEGSGKRITKRPITPKESEIEENPRSRSAKLRIIEKL